MDPASAPSSRPGFTFPLDVDELFRERTRQFVGWGIPEPVVRAVRAEASDAWSEEAGGWTPAWVRQAKVAADRGAPLLAALCYGAAKFPCMATAGRASAYARQLESYHRAAVRFPVRFERHVIDVSYRGDNTPVSVHLLRRRRRRHDVLLVLSGGVDTWKVELHRLSAAIARLTGWSVAALDMPGTGESQVPLAPDADLILRGAIAECKHVVNASATAFFGISFGGHWAAKLALSRGVDAAIDLGGPVGASDNALAVAELPDGMTGIVGNALGLAAMPSEGEARNLFDAFSLRRQGLLDGPVGSPLLVVNGADDAYVAPEDTTVFRERDEATVWVIESATHCAAERIRRVIPAALAWLGAVLVPSSRSARVASAVTRLPLKPLLGRA